MSINTHFHELFVQVDAYHWDLLLPETANDDNIRTRVKMYDPITVVSITPSLQGKAVRLHDPMFMLRIHSYRQMVHAHVLKA